MKKQFLRVKQIADQTFLRAEKSDVLTEDLLIAEKRVDSIKVSCQMTQKKITSCQIDFGSETSMEKRLRKIPQVLLGASMLESGNSFSKNSILGDTLRECAAVQTKLGTELFDYYTEVEKNVLKPVSGVLDNEVHNISKLRKQLGKLVLDMDSARTRFQTAEKHSLQASSNNNFNTVGKVDNLKEELEDASQKVDQCRDALATEMFSLIGREPHLSRLFLQLHQLQAAYHRNALSALEASLPMLEDLICNFPQKPVYGCSLEEHLRVTNRKIAQVIETSVSFLLEYGILEEGLLRIAGSASKLKKLKSAFDAGIELDTEEYARDPHTFAGAFKSYLRELPEPLLTTALYNDWMGAAKQTDFESKLQALWQVLHKLPAANFTNLKFVVKFLAKVQENMDINKMSSQNIAIVMAPNLIWSPTEEASTIGINMSTATLHTSIVDLLISYVDWFFPDEMENSVCPPRSCNSLNLNETRSDDPFGKDIEVNGNNLEAVSSTGIGLPPLSPRSPHNKNTKKPAAPPPPAQMSLDISMDHLIDLSGENIIPTFKKNPNDMSCLKEIATATEILRKEHSDFASNEFTSHKTEKPVVPDKPNYSSCSLDRKSLRQSTHLSRLPNHKPPDLMSRSHIERPSVPPPERPIKAAKFSSQENLSNPTDQITQEVGKQLNPSQPHVVIKQDKDSEARQVPLSSNSSQLSTEVEHPKDEDPTVAPITVQRSRSSTKINRFDFLVNQKEDRPPPERPPRSVEVASSTPVPVPQTIEESASPVSPKSTEVERAKPPRPQPPAKPKLHLQSENTNL